MRERWAEAGLVTRDEMDTNCCYARQDKTWVYDPDGNQWEVFVVLEDNLAETSSCCGNGETDALADSLELKAEPSCGCGTTAPVEIAASA